jgi:integrase
VLDADTIGRLVAASTSLRWQVALGLAGYAGLRLGELGALTWADVNLDAGTLSVRRSLLPDGTAKQPKTEAGVRVVPLLPALRRLLVAWKLRSPRARATDLVVCAANGGHVEERNLRRVLDAAKAAAGLNPRADERLSWHALRHSFASMLATELELPATTLAGLVRHADAGSTLRVYARDGRDTAVVVEDVLARAAGARVGA